jgi:hypothetical protein
MQIAVYLTPDFPQGVWPITEAFYDPNGMQFELHSGITSPMYITVEALQQSGWDDITTRQVRWLLNWQDEYLLHTPLLSMPVRTNNPRRRKALLLM